MSNRQGGKMKPLKAPKKAKKEEDEDDKALKEKQKADALALAQAKERAKGGQLGAGLKKSGKK
ncbi:translation machinery associated TMA7 [Thelephora terrestris]|uniref:Translation machinery associated TMA7 n=1 Tax=Thelephora terrestris TaxID=56493 RepID=A0A9P6HPV6_9AGAM|nr:translation machinery associated TMA7 [Thelephora terrestris]